MLFWRIGPPPRGSPREGHEARADAERAEPGTSLTLVLKPDDRGDGLDDFLDEGLASRFVLKCSDGVPQPVTP